MPCVGGWVTSTPLPISKYTGRKIDFHRVPEELLNAETPLLDGWHRVEISDGAHFYSGLVPDMRFAKDPRQAQRLLDRQVEKLVRQVIKD